MCSNHKFFLQCLEGEQEIVEALFYKISDDARHQQVRILWKSVVEERTFPSWEMAFVDTVMLTNKNLTKYFSDAKFDPYQLLGNKSCDFIVSVAENLNASIKTG